LATVEEQTQLVKVAENIDKKLTYFLELSQLSHRFNQSSASVSDESFFSTLARLDECIAFVSTNVCEKIERMISS
jgi:hypothetical protein